MLATLRDRHSQERIFSNLATLKMSYELGVNLDVRDKFFAAQLKEVKIKFITAVIT